MTAGRLIAGESVCSSLLLFAILQTLKEQSSSGEEVQNRCSSKRINHTNMAQNSRDMRCALCPVNGASGGGGWLEMVVAVMMLVSIDGKR